MQNKKNLTLIFTFLVGLLLISFGSAAGCSNKYHYNEYDDNDNYNTMDTNDGVIFVAYDNRYYGEEVYQKENEDRYPVYDYRFGYSNRAEQSYYTKTIDLNNNVQMGSSRSNSYDRNFMNWLFDGEEGTARYQDKPSYYYTYSEYIDAYEKHTCYNYPPRDKLVYVKCP